VQITSAMRAHTHAHRMHAHIISPSRQSWVEIKNALIQNDTDAIL